MSACIRKKKKTVANYTEVIDTYILKLHISSYALRGNLMATKQVPTEV